MAKNKTTETLNSVTEFVNAVANETKRNDSFRIIELMKSQTGFEPKMWGPSIVGFGSYHYIYDSGREGDAPLIGFSPRKAALVLYMACDNQVRAELLQSFGKHKTEGGCIYVKKLDDINMEALKKMITESVKHTQSLYQDKKK